MRAGSIAALFGIAGFALGWVTRPLAEARAAALTFEELVSHVMGSLHPLLVPAAGACSPPHIAQSAQPATMPSAAPVIRIQARPVACAATITATTTRATTRSNHAGASGRYGVAIP